MSAGLREFVVVIPARLASSRLPEKPLADIGGKTMLERTWERALGAASREDIYVATDSQKIADVCDSFGAQVVLTSEDCMTGTDRIAEFAGKVPARTYINLQGDEPFMPVENIGAVIKAGVAHPDHIINGWAWITEEADWRSGDVPKVVLREDGRLLYMSRAPIPGSKSGQFRLGRRQVCVYAFPSAALKAFASRKQKAEHEEVEDIEILRFVEMGYEVTMIELDPDFISVDRPHDLDRVRAQLVK